MERFHRLAHSVWDCKYHIVWIPKYRRKELYGEKRRTVVETIKQWSRIKGLEIIEGHAMPDHVHLCVSIPPKYSVAHTIGLLKGKSASEVMSFGTKAAEWSEVGHFGRGVIASAQSVLMKKRYENISEIRNNWISLKKANSKLNC